MEPLESNLCRRFVVVEQSIQYSDMPGADKRRKVASYGRALNEIDGVS